MLIYYSLIYYLLFIIYYLSFIIYYLLLYYLLCIIYYFYFMCICVYFLKNALSISPIIFIIIFYKIFNIEIKFYSRIFLNLNNSTYDNNFLIYIFQ